MAFPIPTATLAASQRPTVMGEEHSDSSDFSEEDDLRPSLITSLAHIPNHTTKYLNYTTSYVRKWGCKEAFRESYQNWRDGILRSFNLKLSQFKTNYTEAKRVILVEVRHPETEELLGFIRFQHDKDGYSVGGLKLANFRATLKYGTLGTGATTRAGDKEQTGQHGEGMKLSALVFRRSNYNFRIESGEFKWNFIFKKGELACRLSRMSGNTIGKMKAKAQGQPRTEVAHPWEDVCVVIGAPGATRTIDGDKVNGDRIHVDNFKKWLQVTLDVNPPSKMIRTSQGDLIRDPTYQAHMYLHGLLLPSGGMVGRKYTYGYNFINRTTTRDRNSLAGSSEEGKNIADIWASAMRADDSEDSDVTAEYTILLLNSLNKKGDAMLSSDGNCLEKDIAEKVWKKMLVMNRNAQGRPAFYYSAIEGKDEVQIIERSLTKNPVPLTQEMWKILSKYNLCRTPGKELEYRFQNVNEVGVPKNNFAAHVDRMLKCLLQSVPATKDMELSFVDGKNLQIDAAFSASEWRIHDKWLTYEGAHGNTFCEELDPEADDLFSCDHAVLQLWDIMISQLMASGEYPRITAEEGRLKGMARGRLSQMPRSAKCTANDKRGQLLVLWKSVDSHQHKDKQVKVVLHIDDCTGGRNVKHCLIDNERQCNCPSQLSQAVSDGVTFADLDPNRAYFPSVSRDLKGAFFALPPNPIKPRNEDVAVAPEPGASFAAATEEQHSPINVGQNTIDLSNDDDEDMITNGDSDNDNNNRPSYQALTGSSPPPAPSSSSGAEVGVGATDDTSSQSFVLIVDEAAYGSSIDPSIVAQDKSVQRDKTPQPAGESHVLGAKVEHQPLDWGGSFPGSHDFYRTRDAPDKDVFILKPKTQLFNENGKRPREPEEPRPIRYRPMQPRCEDADDHDEDD